ncbi:recombinase family protein [Bifidobacterium imperatoris]|uniref:DNA resolvase n=1 Tax=Bifidobacterium imperatoris TaxID=2020965 RepID=A0A2N5IT15_9BIFI|nr:recombinase family protein [Bifidobacterium imperatoris]PLS25081.1 DNA resolvase [Bifidobacterium imperatoris]QSY56749.1 recombinase family protein [Bifidobacterium imperatoris]
MKYGYIRVSTNKQTKYGYSLDYQKDAVVKAGAEHVIADESVSGKNMKRPGFNTLQIALHPGDTVIVHSLDRLGRNFKDIVNITDDWNKRNITLIALKENIDTSTQVGITYLQIMASIAQLERRMIIERTEAGRKKAHEQGKTTNRPPTWTDKDALKALDYRENKDFDICDLCIKFKKSEATIFRMLRRAREIKQNENTTTDKQDEQK